MRYNRENPYRLGLENYYGGIGSHCLICFEENDKYYWALDGLAGGTIQEIPHLFYSQLIYNRQNNECTVEHFSD